jgi:hypothetical protein
MSTKRGASPTAPVKTPNPPGPASLTFGEAPREVDARQELRAFAEGIGDVVEHKKGRTGWEDSITVQPARTWTAFGLRPTPEGYVLTRVEMKGNEVMDTAVLRQAEPQRGIARRSSRWR